jgi:hypothetical protein
MFHGATARRCPALHPEAQEEGAEVSKPTEEPTRSQREDAMCAVTGRPRSKLSKHELDWIDGKAAAEDATVPRVALMLAARAGAAKREAEERGDDHSRYAVEFLYGQLERHLVEYGPRNMSRSDLDWFKLERARRVASSEKKDSK